MYFGTIGSLYHTTVATRARFASGGGGVGPSAPPPTPQPEIQVEQTEKEIEDDFRNFIKPSVPQLQAPPALLKRIKDAIEKDKP
jgi:hypothetical protein